MAVSGFLVIKKSGIVFSVNWHGKAAAFLPDGMMLIHIIWYDIPAAVFDITIAVCMIMMAVSLIIYGKRNFKILKKSRKNEVHREGEEI